MGGPGSGRRGNQVRRREAERLRGQGLTLVEIGRRLGISRQGAWHILHYTPRHRANVRCGRCRRAIAGSQAAGEPAGPVCCTGCLRKMPGATFAARLRSLRVARGLSRPALAHLSGLDPSHLSLYERGQVRPRAATLARLVRVLGPGLAVHTTERDGH
jgi:transcriptional regulator with XRE-family HTH domain